jgi:hypothetical protein
MVAVATTALLVAGALGACADDDAPQADPSSSPGQTVGVEDLYADSKTPVDPATAEEVATGEEATPSSTTPEEEPSAPAPMWTGPPPTPTSGPDAGVPYGVRGALVQGADEMFSLSAEEEFVVEQARAVLVEACLAEQGYTDVVNAPTQPNTSGGEPEVFEEMGLIRAASAPFGYHGDPAATWGLDSGQPTMSVNMAGLGGKEAALDVVAGCQGSSEQELAGAQAGDDKLPWQLRHDAEAEAASSSEFTEAVEAWSTCMAGRGFDYTHPTQAWMDSRWAYLDCKEPDEGETRPECAPGVEPTRPELSDTEVATAEADLACKAEVDMVPIFRAAMWEAQSRRIEENRPALEQRLAAQTQLLERAEEVVATGR